jgi:cellulose synthase/poly-beta-1,6-N-acetylglucosamine synthase-like glycosyltransferase
MTRDALFAFIYYFNWFVFWYFIVWNGSYFLLIILSFLHIRNYQREVASIDFRKIFRSSFFKPISVIVPAFNEEKTLPASLESALNLEYPEYEVIVVNDGSTDGTLRALAETFQLQRTAHDVDTRLESKPIRQVYTSRKFPNLTVVDKENGGKADALNAGVNVSKYPLFCSIDADSMLERDCLLKVVRPFMTDARTVVAGGVIRILNGCKIVHGQNVEIGIPKSHLARFQIVEYLRAFLFGRVGLDALNSLLITSGAFTLLRKDVVIACGGYRLTTVGEDMELICRIHHIMRREKTPYRITFVPDPVCWTEVPERFSILARQRNRWHRGLMDSLLSNIGMLFNPRYGAVGLFGMPFFVFFEMLGPEIEVTGYVVFALAWYFHIINWTFAVLFLFVASALGVVLSVTGVFLEEISFRRYPHMKQIATLLVYAVVENFGFRQVLVFCRVGGTLDYLLGRSEWGEMERRGPDQQRAEVGRDEEYERELRGKAARAR